MRFWNSSLLRLRAACESLSTANCRCVARRWRSAFARRLRAMLDSNGSMSAAAPAEGRNGLRNFWRAASGSMRAPVPAVATPRSSSSSIIGVVVSTAGGRLAPRAAAGAWPLPWSISVMNVSDMVCRANHVAVQQPLPVPLATTRTASSRTGVAQQQWRRVTCNALQTRHSQWRDRARTTAAATATTVQE